MKGKEEIPLAIVISALSRYILFGVEEKTKVILKMQTEEWEEEGFYFEENSCRFGKIWYLDFIRKVRKLDRFLLPFLSLSLSFSCAHKKLRLLSTRCSFIFVLVSFSVSYFTQSNSILTQSLKLLE